MDSHIVAPIPSYVATILPLGGVSTFTVVPSSGNESFSSGFHSSVAAINNISATAFPHVYSVAMVPSSGITTTVISSNTIIVPLSNIQ
jgi:hypothetical protein